MKNVSKIVLVALVALVLVSGVAVLTPRAVHAVVATLVQVVNTAANPAITQDTSKQASQILTLQCAPQTSYPSTSSCLQVDDHGQAASTQYQVPASTHFILTSLEYVPLGPSGNANLSIFDQNPSFSAFSQFEFLGITDLTKQTNFQFSSGIDMGSATQPAIVLEPPVSSLIGFYCIRLHGYLTAN
jgi:hypothetical protein